VAATCWSAARRPTSAAAWVGTLGCAAVVIGGGAHISHASARLDGRVLLLWVDAIHQLAAALWIGGLIHLLAAKRRDGRSLPVSVLKRKLAWPRSSSSTAPMVHRGSGMRRPTRSLPDPPPPKVLVFGGLLALGGMNFLSSRLLGDAPAAPPRVRWFIEAEVGLGITVMFIAASLTSLPPAADVPAAERASMSEIADQFTPQWPRLTSPTREELPPSDDPPSTRSQEDIAWSE
jgi:putative copper resistance protein D